MVVIPRRQAVGTKHAPQQPAALDTRQCPVVAEGRGTTRGRSSETIDMRVLCGMKGSVLFLNYGSVESGLSQSGPSHFISRMTHYARKTCG